MRFYRYGKTGALVRRGTIQGMEQNETHKRSKQILRHMKKHIEGGVRGKGVHISELIKALNLLEDNSTWPLSSFIQKE